MPSSLTLKNPNHDPKQTYDALVTHANKNTQYKNPLVATRKVNTQDVTVKISKKGTDEEKQLLIEQFYTGIIDKLEDGNHTTESATTLAQKWLKDKKELTTADIVNINEKVQLEDQEFKQLVDQFSELGKLPGFKEFLSIEKNKSTFEKLKNFISSPKKVGKIFPFSNVAISTTEAVSCYFKSLDLGKEYKEFMNSSEYEKGNPVSEAKKNSLLVMQNHYLTKATSKGVKTIVKSITSSTSLATAGIDISMPIEEAASKIIAKASEYIIDNKLQNTFVDALSSEFAVQAEEKAAKIAEEAQKKLEKRVDKTVNKTAVKQATKAVREKAAADLELLQVGLSNKDNMSSFNTIRAMIAIISNKNFTFHVANLDSEISKATSKLHFKEYSEQKVTETIKKTESDINKIKKKSKNVNKDTATHVLKLKKLNADAKTHTYITSLTIARDLLASPSTLNNLQGIDMELGRLNTKLGTTDNLTIRNEILKRTDYLEQEKFRLDFRESFYPGSHFDATSFDSTNYDKNDQLAKIYNLTCTKIYRG